MQKKNKQFNTEKCYTMSVYLGKSQREKSEAVSLMPCKEHVVRVKKLHFIKSTINESILENVPKIILLEVGHCISEFFCCATLKLQFILRKEKAPCSYSQQQYFDCTIFSASTKNYNEIGRNERRKGEKQTGRKLRD